MMTRRVARSSAGVFAAAFLLASAGRPGGAPWTALEGYALGAQEPADNSLWRRGRVRLSPGETVAPGKTKTFRFQITAPQAAGKHKFRWRMVQEKVQWFGWAQQVVGRLSGYGDGGRP